MLYYDKIQTIGGNTMEHNVCIKCGNISNGKRLCYKCYKEEIENKSIFDLSGKDKFNSKKFKCKNGILVRSKSEMIISNFLTDKGITHYYEKELSFTIFDEYDNKRNIHLRPDFYIPELKINNKIIKNIYIEHWGIENNEEYKWRKIYKIMIYKQAKYTLICTTEDDIYDIYSSLSKKLLKIDQYQIID